MDNIQYLFAAYLAIWIILSLYLFSLHSREKKLRDEVQRLKTEIRSQKTEVRSQESGVSGANCKLPYDPN